MAQRHATAHGRDERHIASVIFNYKLGLLSLESTAPASTPIPSPPPEVGAVIIYPAERYLPGCAVLSDGGGAPGGGLSTTPVTFQLRQNFH